ncbi:hypothetical protein GF371_02855, partial [Candidatus Woesearchaeota archaeon]|nr:hypothetical protein [Candidatus Woesearchaeota archaeon]
MTETAQQDLVRIAFMHSGSSSWDSILDTLQAASEGSIIPGSIKEAMIEEKRARAAQDYAKQKGYQGTKEDFIRAEIRAFEKTSQRSQAARELIDSLKGLDLLLVSNLKMGTEENEHSLQEFAEKVGVRQVRCFYQNPAMGKVEKIGIAEGLNSVFLSGLPNQGMLKVGFNEQPQVLFLGDKVMPGIYDHTIDNGLNTKKFSEFPDSFYSLLNSTSTIITPAYVCAGTSRAESWQITDDRSIDVVHCGPALNLPDEDGKRVILGTSYEADRLEALIFLTIDRQGRLRKFFMDAPGTTKKEFLPTKQIIIDPVRYRSLKSWSAFIADAEKDKTRVTRRRPAPAEQEESHLTERELYLKALHSLPIKNPTVDDLRDLFPHLSDAHIKEDILGKGDPVDVALPPLRVQTDVHQVRFFPGAEGDGKSFPPKIDYVRSSRGEGTGDFAEIAKDYAKEKWGDRLAEKPPGDLVEIVFDDPRDKRGKPGYPSRERIYFTTTRPWNEIVGDAKLFTSRLAENDVDPESFDTYISGELNHGRMNEAVKLTLDITHYKELPDIIIDHLDVAPGTIEPEIPVQPVASDVGDAETVQRKKLSPVTKAFDRGDFEIDDVIKQILPPELVEDDDIFRFIKNAHLVLGNETYKSLVIKYCKLAKNVSR